MKSQDLAKFKDLAIGARFWFKNDPEEYVKVGTSKCFAIAAGVPWSCNPHGEIANVFDVKIKKFTDLLVGAGFRLVDGTAHYVKITEHRCRRPSGLSLSCDGATNCIEEPACIDQMCFRDLDIGSQFYFIDSTILKIKVSWSMYRNMLEGGDVNCFDGYGIGCHGGQRCVLGPVSDTSIKFKDLNIGTRFRFVGGKTLNTKVYWDTYKVMPSGHNKSCTVCCFCIPVPDTFEDLEMGARFRFVDENIVCTKVAEDKYQKLQGVYNWHCNADVSIIRHLFPDTKKFKDLAIGTQFYFVGSETLSTKITITQYEDVSSGVIWACVGDEKCTLDFKSKKLMFKDLAIGAKFKFLGEFEQHTKTTERTYRDTYNNIFNSNKSANCVLVSEPLTFKDLGVGAKFKFDGKGRDFVKTWADNCYTIVKDGDATVERSET